MRNLFKWIGIVVGSLIGLVLVAGIVMFLIGNSRLNKTYDFPPSDLVLPTDEASLDLGKHRVDSLCAGCHAPDLSGIENWFDGGPLGTIDPANLTSGDGGVGATYTTEDFVRTFGMELIRTASPFLCPWPAWAS